MPLSNITVLDLSRVLAGPWCTQILGDLGARVIKIEHPERGDDTRHWGPPFHPRKNISGYYMCANRNKESVTLDFKKEEDKEKLLNLVSQADILVENYKVDSLKPYGLDAQTLTGKFPKLIYCSISAFGQTGPYKDQPGYDALIQGFSGLMSITGESEGCPTKVGVAISDILTGLYCTIGIQSALLERQKSNLGQWCQVSLLDSQVFSLANVLYGYLLNGKNPRPMGNEHPQIVPYGSFKTRDEKSIMIAVGNDRQFANFCKCLEQNWDQLPEFYSNPLRVENRRQLEYEIEKILKTKDALDWLSLFKDKGFPFGPINSLKDLLQDPQVLHNKIIQNINGVHFVKNPIHLIRTPLERYEEPASLGQHNKS